ncbi:MAG TPA: 50S ribosomal protein L19 [Candidatus Saccharimonadales bacterium]|nr:50S ribosomal protein L19 [Candidatus Saccharimonadales bacterium]
MQALQTIEKSFYKAAVPQVQSGDTVRVHQVIREGNKQRIQIFEGVIIRTHRLQELTAVITVRRIASGVGVEKTFLLHSPNVTKVDIVRRAKVRRNFLSYLRQRRGKSARLQELVFDRAAANVSERAPQPKAEASDENLDAEVTELEQTGEVDDVVADESTDELAKAENREAAAEDEVSPLENVDVSEENQLAAEEFQSGVDRAEPKE